MFPFPQWTAAGGRLPWDGPTVIVEQYGEDPQLTRYQLGNHPPGFAEWNDRFRDGMRRFWRTRSTR